MRKESLLKKHSEILDTFLKNKKIHLCDIGAAGGLEPRWKKFSKNIYSTCFEPDERSEIKNTENMSIINKALWSNEGSITLNLTRKPQCSSVYEPNRKYLNFFSDSARFDILNKVQLPATTLNKIYNPNNSFDFIKLDVQGGELEVLKGGAQVLKKCFGLEIEVEFKKLYVDQPLFQDIQNFCQSHGFEFIDFTNISRWERSGYRGLGECNYGDALFLKYPEVIIAEFELGTFSLEEVRSYAGLLYIYRRNDLLLILSQLVEDKKLRAEVAYLANYMEKLNLKMIRSKELFQIASSLFYPETNLHFIQ
jgi:FkbM family methyltransferase